MAKTAPVQPTQPATPADFDAMATRLDAVRLVVEVDQNPDLSYLGEYASEPGPEDRTVDRGERRERNTYRYFIAANSPTETGNPESVKQDYQRMEDYNRQGWCEVGIWAEADVYVAGVRQTFRSGGLWGIEDDGPDDYRQSVAREQVEELRNVLKAVGMGELLAQPASYATKPGLFPRLEVEA